MGRAAVVNRQAVVKVDLGKPVRQWWRKQLGQIVEQGGVTIIQAIGDVGILAMGHLANRLCDPRTPMAVKDTIALVMAPKLAAEVRGRVREGHNTGTDSSVTDLIADYKVST